MYTLQSNNNNAWIVQQHFYIQQQPITDPINNKLKHKEVVLYKTESCRNWTELGHCRYGKKCRYAHGENELRSVPRHTRYKTQICRAYHMDGSCPYGIRCTFVHDSDIQPEKTWHHVRRSSLDTHSSSNSSSDNGDFAAIVPHHHHHHHQVKQLYYNDHPNNNDFRCYIPPNNKAMWM